MFRKLRNKRAQNTAEYAILIALVIGGVVAMQTYAQRALQGRIRDASHYMRNGTSELGTTLQYEPYYSCSTSETTSDKTESYLTDGYNGLTSQIVMNKEEMVLRPSTTGE